MKVCVTGSEGFVGRHVVAAIPGAYRFDLKAESIWDAGLMEDCDRYIHLAAMAGVHACLKAPAEAFVSNECLTFQVLSEAQNSSASVVFASSAAAANPTNPYAASKAAAEVWCRAYRESYGMEVAVLRFANVYGPGSLHKSSVVAAMCRSAIERGEIVLHGDGSQTRDLVHVRDVVTALLEARNGDASVRTGKLTRISDLAQHIRELSGARICRTGEAGAASSRDDWPRVQLEYTDWRDGVEETYRWFRESLSQSR